MGHHVVQLDAICSNPGVICILIFIIMATQLFLQLPLLVSLLCISPPPPSESTGHLQLPHPPDIRSRTLWTLQALQCQSVVAIPAAMRYPTSVPQLHTVSVLCLSMGPPTVTLLDQCWLQEVSCVTGSPIIIPFLQTDSLYACSMHISDKLM